ncbi:hypothetical protein RUND412_002154 [Rhizina undulata]
MYIHLLLGILLCQLFNVALSAPQAAITTASATTYAIIPSKVPPPPPFDNIPSDVITTQDYPDFWHCDTTANSPTQLDVWTAIYAILLLGDQKCEQTTQTTTYRCTTMMSIANRVSIAICGETGYWLPCNVAAFKAYWLFQYCGASFGDGVSRIAGATVIAGVVTGDFFRGIYIFRPVGVE